MLNGLDLFSGIGGLTSALAPWVRPVAYCENDAYAQSVLLSRMAGGQLPIGPIWDDIRSFKGRVAGDVDIIYGGFPCQDTSDASRGRGKGLLGERSGLWYEMLRLIRELQPTLVFIEHVDGGAWKKWLPEVRKGLAEAGYESRALRISAGEVGAHFRGARIFVAATNRKGQSTGTLDAQVDGLSKSPEVSWRDWGPPPPEALGVDDGVPCGVERLRAVGNAVVPVQAREAFKILTGLKDNGEMDV